MCLWPGSVGVCLGHINSQSHIQFQRHCHCAECPHKSGLMNSATKELSVAGDMLDMVFPSWKTPLPCADSTQAKSGVVPSSCASHAHSREDRIDLQWQFLRWESLSLEVPQELMPLRRESLLYNYMMTGNGRASQSRREERVSLSLSFFLCWQRQMLHFQVSCGGQVRWGAQSVAQSLVPWPSPTNVSLLSGCLCDPERQEGLLHPFSMGCVPRPQRMPETFLSTELSLYHFTYAYL
jgi:hypothetical protein